MSFQVTKAVLDSELERPLRLLALALAEWAGPQGDKVRPSVATLAGQVKTSRCVVQRGLKRLRALGVLVVESRVVVGADGTARPAGGRQRPTRYRFDLDALAALPPAPKRSAKTVSKTMPFSDADPAPKGHRFGSKRVAFQSQKGSASDPRSTSDPPGSKTGADAPESPARKVPFRVYVAIATKAIRRSRAEDGTENLANFAFWFKAFCAEQHLSYGPEICRKAIDAALAAERRPPRAGHRRPQSHRRSV